MDGHSGTDPDGQNDWDDRQTNVIIVEVEVEVYN